MSDALIERLATDLRPVPATALQRRIFLSLAAGLAAALIGVILFLDTMIGRPFGAAWGSPMLWVKIAYALAFGILGLAAAPALARPDGRIVWPLVAASALTVAALGLGGAIWMGADWSMPMLMGSTALLCPWLILLTSAPILVALLIGMRRLAPRSPALAGFASGLSSGGLGAALYAIYCGETGMLFIAVWYSLGIALTAGVGMFAGRWLLRW